MTAIFIYPSPSVSAFRLPAHLTQVCAYWVTLINLQQGVGYRRGIDGEHGSILGWKATRSAQPYRTVLRVYWIEHGENVSPLTKV